MGGAAISFLRGVFLGLDTSGLQTGLALVESDRVLYEHRTTGSGTHNEVLLPLISRALKAVGLTLEELSGILLAIGPGMWTGLRVGLSTVKGLALPGRIAVKGVNTLEAIAATANAGDRAVLAVIDARRGELYAGLYQGQRVLISPRPTAAQFLVRMAAELALPDELVLAGDGSGLIQPLLAAAGVRFVDSGVRQPAPAVIVRLGVELLQRLGPDRLEELEPLYLRRTDAELNREQRLKGCL